MSFTEEYPHLHKLGLSSSILFAVMDDSDDELFHDGINVSTCTIIVTNETVIQLYNFMRSHSKCTFFSLWQWLAFLYGSDWPEENFPTISSVRQSILRLSEKFSKLKKLPAGMAKNADIFDFLNTAYVLPGNAHSQRLKPFASSSSSSSSESCATCSSCETLHKEVKILEEENLSLRYVDQKLRKKMYSLHRNSKKKLDRKDYKLSENKKVLRQLHYENSQCNVRLNSLKLKLDNMRHRFSYWKTKYNQAISVNNDDSSDCDKFYIKLNEEIACLHEQNSNLRETVEQVMAESKDEIVTFEKGRYTDDIRTCCYELLSLNVGVNNVAPVINTVLKNIAHKEVDRLPCRTVLCNMMIECLTIAQAQLGEELTEATADNHTLQTDGTTKYGTHFSTYDISTLHGDYTLGIRHVFSGSAQNTLDTLLEILEDLDAVRNKIGKSDVSSIIISKIKNTMSDRHAAEKLFSQILSEYRESILPDVVSGWREMSEQEQEQVTRINNFYCGLHFLVGLADAADASVKIWEATFIEGSTCSSGTQRLIRTACKSFHHRGSEQAGCSTFFRTFLRRKGITKIPLAAFKGNRFNILFYDAGGVYFLRSHMIDYLKNHHGGNLNNLLKAVLDDLQVPYYIAGCKALGIIDKVVTGPFWRLLQTSDISILQMSDVYTQMKSKFDDWSKDSQFFLDGSDCLFADLTDRDNVFLSLLEPAEIDDMVQELLQLIFLSFSQTIQRLLVDHLPDGRFYDVSDPLIVAETASVPKTNVNPERDFAILDRLLSQKPNASYIALESLLLYSHNKTSTWLESKSSEERERLLKAAQSMTTLHRQNFLKRTEEIHSKRVEVMKEKERKQAEKNANELKSKEDLMLQIQKAGYWISFDDINRNLKSYSSKKSKVDALKLQINFRKKVIGQTHVDKSIFQFTKNRKPLSVEQLSNNLMILVSASGSQASKVTTEDVRSDPEILIYRRIEHLFEVENSMVWYKGTVLSYDKNSKEYTVVYDGEEESFNFQLFEDMLKRELRVIS